ncbi:MAG: glycoside hydrolase family 3 C-terminal domain-containing protein [Lachnospiraceae bacterium]|nr:glycoside hydrolase family 3 C-terminal domain-containing protein [Lachnospiraceae bacterium]
MELNDYEIRHNAFLRENGAGCALFLKRDETFPLSEPGPIALYGSGARRTIKGGTGSGEVNSRYSVSIEEGLINAGFSITTSKWLDEYDAVREEAYRNFVKQVRRDARKHHVLAIVEGMGRVMPEPAYALPISGVGETAIYVLSRISGEGSDRSPVEGDVKLTPTEIRDILISNHKYQNFLLVINTGGPVDLSPVLDDVENILILSQLGVETGDILADIVLGKSDPSGKLTTTWTKWEDYPKIGNFGDKNDTNYTEGIYVGYRYFDSLFVEPQFPFGFGLSYTDFVLSEPSASIKGSKVTVHVNVTNTGRFPGREVVQVYLSAPRVALDKPYQELCAFIKTPPLSPRAMRAVSLSFDLADMASFDTENSRFVLEEGDYIVRVGDSSANTKPVAILHLPAEVTTRKVRSCFGESGVTDYVSLKFDREENLDEVEQLEIDPAAFKTVEVVYDKDVEIAEEISKLQDEQLVAFNIGEYGKGGLIGSVIGEASTHVAGAAGETTNVLEKKGYPVLVMSDGPAGLRISQRYYIDAEEKRHAIGESLPATMIDFMPKALLLLTDRMARKQQEEITGPVHEQYATAIPIGTAIAQSFDLDFAKKCGDIVGEEMELFGVDLWLAPALNIHRSILCGRNFEYYSEDPIVSGLFAAAITNGVQSHPGRGVTIKHYAANNQETNRYNSNSHVSERAMREIYLKGFGICVRESQPRTVMTSYNLLNGTHTAERRDLIEDVLRDEFGFKGVVMTDWVVNGGTMDRSSKYPAPTPYKVAAAGNDLFMPGSKKDYESLLKALQNGKISRTQLEINATRVYRLACEMKAAQPAPEPVPVPEEKTDSDPASKADSAPATPTTQAVECR